MNSTILSKLVVLVDDEPSVLLALKMMISTFGFEVREFNAAAAALQYLKDGGRCDVLLSDLRMPEIDGIMLLREVRALSSTIPFILISGHATAEDVARATELGANGFLGKPFTPAALQNTLTKYSGSEYSAQHSDKVL